MKKQEKTSGEKRPRTQTELTNISIQTSNISPRQNVQYIYIFFITNQDIFVSEIDL